jgi:hypothetical protein
MGFGGSSAPKPKSAAVMPEKTSPDAEAAKNAQREKRRRMAGREDTVLTPGFLQPAARKDQLG